MVGEILRLLANEFRFVVVDTSPGLDEHTLAAIDEATDLVLVCSMDVPNVRGLRKEIAALDAMKIHGPKRHFVLNRADSRVGLDVDDVVATVGMPVDVELPSSRSVPLALNQGTPLIESDPRSPIARQFMGLVERFVEVPDDGGGLFRKRRKR